LQVQVCARRERAHGIHTEPSMAKSRGKFKTEKGGITCHD